MVITPQGYTKYYYSGKEHVATQIGNVSHMQAQFTQSDTIAGMISKSNTFMQSAIGVSDSYTERPPILYTASGSRIVGQLGPHCSTTLLRVISTSSLQNQLLPVISGDVSGMETDPLEPALYYYHADHLGSATWITDSIGNPAQFLQYLPYGERWRNQQRMVQGAIKATPASALPTTTFACCVGDPIICETLRWFLWGPRDWFS